MTSGGSRPAGPDRRRGEALKRRAYMFVLALLSAFLVGQIALHGVDVPYWGIARPLLAAYDVVLLVVIWRTRVSLRTSEALLLGPLMVALLGYLVAWRVAPASMAAESTDVVLVMLWAGMAFPLCFLLLGTRRGLQTSVAIYALFLALVVPPAVSGDIPAGTSSSPSTVALSLAGFFAVLIALLAVLASRLEELAATRAQAGLFAAQATTDPLTGLPNRRGLDQELERRIALAHRHDQALSVVLVDIDRFKAVNDQLGHDAGDRALVELAGRLAASVRDGDVVGRWGGEEFLLIASHTDHDAARQLAERCRSRIAAAAFEGGGHLTASFGVITLASEDEPGSLLRRADLALYAAKNGGRDRVVGLSDLDSSPYTPGVGEPGAVQAEPQS